VTGRYTWHDEAPLRELVEPSGMLRLCGDSELELSMLEGRSGLYAIRKLEAESEGSEMVCDIVEDMGQSSSSLCISNCISNGSDL
jgi:hypothetical protein